jgi:hypothetical protein
VLPAGECGSMRGTGECAPPFVRPEDWLVNSIEFLYMQEPLEFAATAAFGRPIAKHISLFPEAVRPG